MPSTRRPPQSAGDDLPPPPYRPLDSNSSSNQTVPAPQSRQPQFAPPPGPPPGGYPPPNSNNPFADPNGPTQAFQSSYPAMQPNSAPAQASTYPSSNAISNSPPRAPGGFASPAAGVGRRQGSVEEHARQMSVDFSGMNVGGAGATTVQRNRSTREDPLEFLRSFDTIFIVDDSASMHVNEQPDGSMGPSRWEEARDALAGVVELAAKYDDDGVDVHFLNSERELLSCRSAADVRTLFDQVDPEGTTPIGTKLEMLLLQYMDDIETWKEKRIGPEPKKRNYIIITDGAATDDPESVIVACATRLDAAHFPLSQIGIQFIQVGNDAEASEALTDLDDALAKEYKIRDMVDTTTYSGMCLSQDMITKALMGGVNRRLDRKKDRGSTTGPGAEGATAGAGGSRR